MELSFTAVMQAISWISLMVGLIATKWDGEQWIESATDIPRTDTARADRVRANRVI